MTLALGFDAGLAGLIAVLALWTTAAREVFTAVSGFVAFGLLLALAWVRLAAPDVALTEAAIGSGLTGGLLIAVAGRLQAGEKSSERETPALALRIVSAVVSILVTAGLAAIVLLLPMPAPTLAPEAAANIALTGLENPVTAVLMAYRAIDTLLEVVVLLLALLGVWSLAPDRFWGGRPGLPQREEPDSILIFFGRLLPPLGVLVAIHLFWVGSVAPGGEFQSATVLAAMWILALMAGLVDAPPIDRRWLRLLLVIGPAGFPCDRARGICHGRDFSRLSSRSCEIADRRDRAAGNVVDHRDTGFTGCRSAAARATRMNSATLFGLSSAVLVGLGLYGLIVDPQPLRKVIAFNLLGAGVFLLFGVVARRGAAAGFAGDPIPQALVITGLVVAFASTALAVALTLRLVQETGRATLEPDSPTNLRPDDPDC